MTTTHAAGRQITSTVGAGAPVRVGRRVGRRAGRWVASGVVAAGVLLVPMWSRSTTDDAERQATAAEASAGDAAAARRAADAAVAAELEGLAAARVDARAAAHDVAAQRGSLADLAIVEADLERVVAEALATTEGTEATRDATASRVQRQAVELPQLEACLVEVRRSLDRAFHATNDPRVTVPPLSDTCRVLSTAAGG